MINIVTFYPFLYFAGIYVDNKENFEVSYNINMSYTDVKHAVKKILPAAPDSLVGLSEKDKDAIRKALINASFELGRKCVTAPGVYIYVITEKQEDCFNYFIEYFKLGDNITFKSTKALNGNYVNKDKPYMQVVVIKIGEDKE